MSDIPPPKARFGWAHIGFIYPGMISISPEVWARLEIGRVRSIPLEQLDAMDDEKVISWHQELIQQGLSKDKGNLADLAFDVESPTASSTSTEKTE